MGETVIAKRPARLSRNQVVWPLVIAALIFLASSRSHVASPGITNIDKVTHFSVYGLLATLVCRLGTGWRAGMWSLLAVSAFGISDEWHQSFVPGRATEFADWVADTAGAATAIALYFGWPRYRAWLERRLGRGTRPAETSAS